MRPRSSRYGSWSLYRKRLGLSAETSIVERGTVEYSAAIGRRKKWLLRHPARPGAKRLVKTQDLFRVSKFHRTLHTGK